LSLHQITDCLYLRCAANLAEHGAILFEPPGKVRHKTFVQLCAEGPAQKRASGLILHIGHELFPFGSRYIGQVGYDNIEARALLYAGEQVGADTGDSVEHSMPDCVVARHKQRIKRQVNACNGSRSLQCQGNTDCA